MAKMTIIKRISVNRSAADVFPLVHDFHNWIQWSPWHILDDANNYKVSDDGSKYEWDSKLLGAGKMERLNAVENKIVESDLIFLKPWKSKSKIIFRVLPISESTCEVVWEMHGKMPFFMFFFIKMMERMVGMDFMRGLHLLKDYAEHGTNRCQIKIPGENKIQDSMYIGLKYQCSFDDLGEKNKQGFEKLMTFVRDNQLELNGPPATIYHEFNFRKNTTHFTVAAPLVSRPDNLPGDFVFEKFIGGNFYAVELKGPYYHLGTAWAALSTRQRGKVFKPDSSRSSIEVYLNSPLDTSEENLISVIYSPVK